MGIVAFLLVLGCIAALGIWLGKALGGRLRLLLWAGVTAAAFGALTISAVVILPRAVFGELGHGDGAGLMGLMLFGAIGMAAGLFLLVIAAVIFFLGHSRRNNLS